MFAKLSRFLLVLALIGATGTHWLMLQSVAWATMLADNARVASLSEALERTFDGKHPCSLCKHIAREKQSEKQPAVSVEGKKLEFSHSPTKFVFNAPTATTWLLNASHKFGCVLNNAPPVPPPRNAAV